MAAGKKQLTIDWNGGVDGQGKVAGGYLKTQLAIAPRYGGSGDGTDPLELLLSSAASCYMSTLVAMLASRSVPVSDVSMVSEVEATREGTVMLHRPRVVLAPDATEEQRETAMKIPRMADRGCTVGNLLKKAGTVIHLEAEVQ